MIKIYYFFLSSLFLISCNDSSVIGKTCNGKNVIQGTERKSECNVLREWWGTDIIPFDVIMDIPRHTHLEIQKAKLAIGVYRNKSLEERKIIIDSLRSELSIYKGKKWKSFVEYRREGDHFYTFSSGKQWPVGAGYILVRNSKVVASFYLIAQ